MGSAKLEGSDKIRVKHKTSTGAFSEAMLQTEGDGPGELWGCHWNFWVCLPQDQEDLIYGIVLEGVKDDNIGRSIKFKVDNIFANEADVFVRYEKKVGQYANEPMCESMPNTKSGCDVNAKSIEVGCIEFGNGVEPFALVDLYFASKEPNSFIKQIAADDTTVHKCCKAPETYNEEGYGVVKYTLKIQCACPDGGGDGYSL